MRTSSDATSELRGLSNAAGEVAIAVALENWKKAMACENGEVESEAQRS